MKRRIVGCISAVVGTWVLFFFYLPVQAAEFTADWFNTKEGVTYKAKIYVKDDLSCVEKLDGPEPVILVIDQGKPVSIVMNPLEKYYVELQKNLSGLEPDKDRIIGAEKKHMGMETVNGLVCDKYQYLLSESKTAAILNKARRFPSSR